MVAKFRALREEDYRKQVPIRNRFFSDNYSALNYQPENHGYADWDSDTPMFYRNDNGYVRTYFRLVAPTFNYVLGMSSCELLWKILGVPKSDYEGIINFTKVMDCMTEELVDINDTDNNGRYLYGAQIAEHYIDDFDFDEAITRELYKAASSVLSQSYSPRSIFQINQSGNGMFVAADYYLSYDDKELLQALKRTVNFEDVQKIIQNTLLKSERSRFTYLLNMDRDKSGLYGMLNYHIMIIPSEMRPKEENREHKLTKRYAQVVTYNEELRMNIDTATPIVIRTSYLNLERATQRLQYKLQDVKGVTPDDRSIMERIKSKKGQIRFRNLGKRQDYSGRAVVCINPFLPVDVIRVPKAMLPKLLEYHALPYLVKHIEKNEYHKEHGTHVDNIYDKVHISDLSGNLERKVIMNIIEQYKLLDKIPMCLGRQPTLHKQSLQGFHVEPTDLTAIEVNPTVCPAFNMDFDGDQAHIEVPLSPEAIQEVLDLVMTSQNLFMAKDGSVTTAPRMDMLYGLYMCTKDNHPQGESKGAYNNLEEVRQAVMKHVIKPWDTVITPEFGQQLAGDAAFMACFPLGDLVPRNQTPTAGKLRVEQVDKKSINKYMSHALRVDTNGDFVHPLGTKDAEVDTIIGIINHLVETGFRVANLYPPNLSLLQDSIMNTAHHDILEKFHQDTEDTEFYYNIGLETHDRYSFKYEQQLSEVMDYYKKELVKSLEEDNGYRLLMESGARGSADNIRQTFGIKGRVQKNETEHFDAIIENAYATQLTTMESFVSAYGGRQGQIDKSLKTGDTGYAMRKMWHTTQGLHITCEDCGTSEGMVIDKADLRLLSSAETEENIQDDVQKMFEHAILGRYQVGSDVLINETRAHELATNPAVPSIKIRSPLKCNKPCCQKCYGIDWSTHKLAVIGLPIGIIAAQSIGEPGTQLVLKNFQKGGIVTAGNITSAFDKVDSYLKVSDLAKASKEGKYSGYDPIAWADGEIVEKRTKDPKMKSISIKGSSKRLEVPDSLVVKATAVKGRGLSINHGDYCLRELLEYAGIDFAQFYLVFKLFALYRSEIEIKMCHFETLVAMMTRYMITKTDRKDLMVGQYCSSPELYAGSVSGTEYIPRLIPTSEIPTASMSALDSIIMESQVEGLSRICALGLTDNLTKPINSMVFGQSIKDGSAYPNFIQDRRVRV